MSRRPRLPNSKNLNLSLTLHRNGSFSWARTTGTKPTSYLRPQRRRKCCPLFKRLSKIRPNWGSRQSCSPVECKPRNWSQNVCCSWVWSTFYHSVCPSALQGIYRKLFKALRIMRNSRRLVGIDLFFYGTLQVALPRGVLQRTWAKYTSLNSIKMQPSLRAVIHLFWNVFSMLCLNLFLGSFDTTVKLWDLRYICLLEFFASWTLPNSYESAPQGPPIQVLDEARDGVQTLHVGPTFIVSGSIDGHVRTYDLRMGELRSDFIGRGCSMYR